MDLSLYSQALECQMDLVRAWTGGRGLHKFVDSKIEALRLAHDLQLADPYFVSKEIGQLVEHAARSFPDNVSLTADLLMSHFGWLYFSESIKCHNLRIKAFSWSPIRQRLPGHQLEGIELVPYVDDKIYPHPLKYSPLLFRLTVNNFIEAEKGIDHQRNLTEKERQLSKLAEIVTSLTSEERIKFDQEINDIKQKINDPDNIIAEVDRIRIFLCLLSFMNQKLVVAQGQSASEQVKRRYRREHGQQHNPPAIKVIVLRRKEHAARLESEENKINWSYRWLVSGHWRQQWYSSIQAHKALWIHPYAKGPEDKPLKQPVKLFAVVR
jgi:hypothetical protein